MATACRYDDGLLATFKMPSTVPEERLGGVTLSAEETRSFKLA